ncbi:DUF2939 domain-containing protein [Brevundimonas sp.]|uniref:DUF2939 domain-containing protein n=1 Tax=Brevundimonas sp. TaxID=1871086 RepID=UPI001D8B84BB|nr:DUF2939 domain-containing protein [Brevundimonas sp.]MBA4001647.1 hypothetical protein [Brevundimonas sp.]
MKRALFNLFLLAIAAAIIGFFAAPGVAFFALRSAAQSGDAGSLGELVDFGAVRQSLRPQLDDRPEAQAPPPAFLEDPIGAVRRQLEDAARPAVDVNAWLTPAALAGLTAGEGRYAAERSRPGGAPPDMAGAPWPAPRYWGVNRVRMAVADEGGSETVFTFERRGAYRWVLVHIRLPEGGTPVAAPEASPAA